MSKKPSVLSPMESLNFKNFRNYQFHPIRGSMSYNVANSPRSSRNSVLPAQSQLQPLSNPASFHISQRDTISPLQLLKNDQNFQFIDSESSEEIDFKTKIKTQTMLLEFMLTKADELAVIMDSLMQRFSEISSRFKRF